MFDGPASPPIHQPTPIGPDVAAQEQAAFTRRQRAGVIPQVPNLDGAFDPSFNDAVRP
ncbi:MAG: hypothetical protein JO303_07780 [Caulobacteraceae bacterium]|nr:hypothetical protein [Caulobacteraceae bacterium]